MKTNDNNFFNGLLLRLGQNKKLALLVLTALTALVGCVKPDPNQNNQNQEPIKKYDTIYWGSDEMIGRAPPTDTILKHLANPNVEKVIIHLMKNKYEINAPADWTGSRPSWLSMGREQLQADLELDSLMVGLSGGWKVKKIAEPGVEPDNDERGVLPWADAQYLRQHNLNIIVEGEKGKSR